jgi:hypothetical protein
MDFLDLPAEIRIRIYEEVMGCADRPSQEGRGKARRKGPFEDYTIIDIPPPTCASLRAFSAFLVSCRKIYYEFEFEAMKAMQIFLHNEVQPTWLNMKPGLPLVLPSPKRLPDTINMEFGIPIAYYSVPLDDPDYDERQHQGILIHTLLDTLSSFSLYPISETETNYITYSQKSYSVKQHFWILLNWRRAEFTMNGQSDYKGMGKLYFCDHTCLVSWDAECDSMAAYNRFKSWDKTPVRVAIQEAAAKLVHMGES